MSDAPPSAADDLLRLRESAALQQPVAPDTVEAGLRQLRRSVPLETEQVALPSGHQVTVPTLAEALRVKAYLVLQRNQVRDYLDVVALAEAIGPAAPQILIDLDRYYDDRDQDEESVASALAARLAKPDPRDTRTLSELPRYKGLAARWHDWAAVVAASCDLAAAMLDGA